MKFAPQLCERIEITDLPEYISSPQFYFEQKANGHRLLIRVEDGQCQGYNRRGEPVKDHLANVVRKLEPFLGATERGTWVFDGEWVNGVYWLFDMPEALTQVSIETPLFQRRFALEAIYEALDLGRTGIVKVIPSAQTAVEKRDLLEWAALNDVEGVVIKKKNAPYRPGKRHGDWMKAKFTETVDCIISEVRRGGKESCSVDLIDETGTPVNVGHVKMTDKQLRAAHVDCVIEVEYLYMTAERRLYQAQFKGFRPDKTGDECTIDQCKITNDTVRH